MKKSLPTLAYSLSYASPEADFTSPQVFALLTDQQKRQLDHCDEASSAEWTHRSASAVAAYDTRRELLDDHAHAAATDPALPQQEQFHFEEIYARAVPSPPPSTRPSSSKIRPSSLPNLPFPSASSESMPPGRVSVDTPRMRLEARRSVICSRDPKPTSVPPRHW